MQISYKIYDSGNFTSNDVANNLLIGWTFMTTIDGWIVLRCPKLTFINKKTTSNIKLVIQEWHRWLSTDLDHFELSAQRSETYICIVQQVVHGNMLKYHKPFPWNQYSCPCFHQMPKKALWNKKQLILITFHMNQEQ